MKFLILWIFHWKNKMESVWNGNGKGMEKLIRSKLGEMDWNWNGTGMEMEWNIYEEIWQ